MGAMPEKLAAPGALKVLMDPEVGLGRNAVAHLLFVHFKQFAAAFHAPRVVTRKSEFGPDETQLLQLAERWGHPDGRNLASDDQAAVEQHRIGGYDDAAGALSLGDENAIVHVLHPNCVATGGAEPSCETAETGIAKERLGGEWRFFACAVTITM